MSDTAESLDVVVVGAGFSGLYLVHRLREMGNTVVAFEAGDCVGGTWYWNRYPGARCDVPSLEYSYSFSEELEQEWVWTERYPTQPEILRYLNHVADRFGLRTHIRLESRVVSAAFDDATARWTVATDRGDRLEARYLVMATGCLTEPKRPEIPGVDLFGGEWHLTSRWPEAGVDVRGKRVGVIGTGSTGVQVIPQLARFAAHLTVFQRTPCYSIPAQNRPLSLAEQAAFKAEYRTHRAQARTTPTGMLNPRSQHPATDFSPEEQRDILERGWQIGGSGAFMGAFNDIMLNRASNEVLCEFIRDKIRSTVDDPATAELLSPTTYPVGTRRICIDIDYFETYNRDNVSLVDVRTAPIVEFTADGLRTTKADYELDVLVFATGFDAMTGALLSIDIQGRDGRKLRDVWAEGPSSYLGLGIHGFPNLFTVTGPFSPSVLTNVVVSLEDHVVWITDCIAYLDANGIEQIEPTEGAERAWVEHAQQVANATLLPQTDSWYVGANIAGKPRMVMQYLGGLQNYRARCTEIAENLYEGFLLTSKAIA